MQAAELQQLGPRHLDKMSIGQLRDLHAKWTHGEPVSRELIRIAQKKWSCVLRARTREATHAPCATCAAYKRRRKAASSVAEMNGITTELRKHRDDVTADRRVSAYYNTLSRTATSIRSTLIAAHESVLDIVLDGMGVSKFMCPRNVDASKLWDTLWRPTLGFIGVLVHCV